MTDKKKQPESPLARAMRTGTLGGTSEKTINGDTKKPAPEKPEKEQDPVQIKPEENEKRRRITAYVAPDIYQWTKVRAALEDRELSEIVEDALRQYKARVEP
jgi:hypothetical protein